MIESLEEDIWYAFHGVGVNQDDFPDICKPDVQEFNTSYYGDSFQALTKTRFEGTAILILFNCILR